METNHSMDASALMQKLVEKKINTSLLIEFYEEVMENEKVFCSMVEPISDPSDILERQRSVEHIEHFCAMLKELQLLYHPILSVERYFRSEKVRREKMINNATRFLELLEKDCNIQSPSDRV